jgi:hypothetical protein
MRRHVAAVLVGAACAWLVSSRPASADITAFVGLAGGPAVRTGWGAAVSMGMLVVGFELEYAKVSQSIDEGAPGMKSVSGNLLLQTPMSIGGVQLYGTAGAGGYHQDLGLASETNALVNVGGGAKVNLTGPLRLRIDYRVFKLMGSPFGAANVHRVYVGANIKF